MQRAVRADRLRAADCVQSTARQVRGESDRNGELTYDMGLRLAVMALRVEAALTLAFSGRGLEVRRNCAGGHCVYMVGLG